MSRRLFWAAALTLAAVLAVALWLAYGDEVRAARARQRFQRIVLVTFDTLNVRFTGAYNPEIDYTPEIDRIAAEGVLFRRAYTTVPITLPSHATLMSGRAPEELGVMLNGDVVGDEVETLAEILRRHGYRTAAFTSLGVLEDQYRLDQGFDHFDDQYFLDVQRWYRTADEVFAAARGWLESDASEPWFAWVHFSDPHEPYVEIGAPPDCRLTLDGEPVHEATLATKTRQTARLRLAPGRHRLVWTSLRPARPDDKPETRLLLRLLDVERLESWRVDDGPDLALEQSLRQPFALELEVPGAGPPGEPAVPVELAVRFEGRLESPGVSELLDQYAREVAYADRYLGELRRLVETAGEPEKTLWILASDHGEGLHHKNILGHAEFVQEDQLRILWAMKGPGIASGQVIDEPVLAEDLLPTLLDLMGLSPPERMTGASQAGCWSGGDCRARDAWWAYGASAEDQSITAVAGYALPYKLVWQREPGSGAYDLSADPWEDVNLGTPYTRDPSLMPQAMEELNRLIWPERDRLEELLAARPSAAPTPEQQEMLKSLGYLGN